MNNINCKSCKEIIKLLKNKPSQYSREALECNVCTKVHITSLQDFETVITQAPYNSLEAEQMRSYGKYEIYKS